MICQGRSGLVIGVADHIAFQFPASGLARNLMNLNKNFANPPTHWRVDS